MAMPHVGIIGVGKLGAALWDVLLARGLKVKGVDTSVARRLQLANRYKVTDEFDTLQDTEIVFVLVNTTGKDGYSYEHLCSALKAADAIKGATDACD